jgi:hypothetical protein
MDPRSLRESTHTTLSDLDLLLAEADREDEPYLSVPAPEATAARDTDDIDDIDDQILAGLVTP